MNVEIVHGLGTYGLLCLTDGFVLMRHRMYLLIWLHRQNECKHFNGFRHCICMNYFRLHSFLHCCYYSMSTLLNSKPYWFCGDKNTWLEWMNEWMLVHECRSICVPQENNKTKKMFSFHLGVSVCECVCDFFLWTWTFVFFASCFFSLTFVHLYSYTYFYCKPLLFIYMNKRRLFGDVCACACACCIYPQFITHTR